MKKILPVIAIALYASASFSVPLAHAKSATLVDWLQGNKAKSSSTSETGTVENDSSTDDDSTGVDDNGAIDGRVTDGVLHEVV